MTSVDVTTAIHIARPRREVAAYAADPDHAPDWYANIDQVSWQTKKPMAVGSRLAFVARFRGRTLEYSYEVTELVPGERLVMTTSEGPFPMETSYAWADRPGGQTHMTLRNRGTPFGFGGVVAPIMSAAIRRANRNDLSALKALLEGR